MELADLTFTQKGIRKSLFVRAANISIRTKENPFTEGDFEMAWLQPVWFRAK